MELIWDGKYDAHGQRTEPPRIGVPLRVVEIVASADGMALDLIDDADDSGWRNRLVRGDKSVVLPSLLAEFAGKVDLIYIDPPFDTGRDFSFLTTVRGREDAPADGTLLIEQRAYRDTWRKGLDSYLQWFYETATLLRELLAPDGSLYIHLDWRAGHYAKAILDEVFGTECFQNEIAWCYREAINSTKRWNRKHDNILFYVKDPSNYQFNPNAVLQPHSASTIAKYRLQDEKGPYRLMGRGIEGSPIRSARDVAPEWEKSHPDLVYRHYLRDGTYAVDYWNIDIINQASHERVNYPTQKPEALLNRIIEASTRTGDLVLDCFCGSGTTAVSAEKLGRRWIACDLGRFAIHAARKRLVGIPGVRAFVVQEPGEAEITSIPRGRAGIDSPCDHARVEIEVSSDGRDATITLCDFRMPADGVPADARRAVTRGDQWIDYWAIDWDAQGDAFRNRWRAFRTRKDRGLAMRAYHTYPEAGEYRIMIHVVDILGNTTASDAQIRID